VLTSWGASLKVKGEVYRACIQSGLGYASETWTMKVEDVARLERRTERMTARWMFDVQVLSRTSCAELNSQLVIECISDVVRRADCRGLIMWRERIVKIGFQHVDVLKLL